MFLSKYLERKEDFTRTVSQILLEVILNEGRTTIPRIYEEVEARTGIDKNTVRMEIDMLIRLDYLFIENNRIRIKDRLWNGLS